jgi:hypothetical protein
MLYLVLVGVVGAVVMVIGAVRPLFDRLVGPSIDRQRELGGTFRMSRPLGRIGFVVFGAFA